MKTTESHQGQPTETERSRVAKIARKVGRPLLGAILAVGVSTAGVLGFNAYKTHNRQGYVAEQKKLEPILRPTMVKIDRKFTEDHNKDPKRYTLAPLNDGTGRVQITDTGFEGTAFAVMGTDKSGNPDPQKPRFIEVGTTGVGTGNVSAIWLGAPGGEDFAQQYNPPNTVGEGWQAAEDAGSPFPIYSTANPSLIVAGTIQSTPTPVQEAQGVIDDWNQNYGSI